MKRDVNKRISYLLFLEHQHPVLCFAWRRGAAVASQRMGMQGIAMARTAVSPTRHRHGWSRGMEWKDQCGAAGPPCAPSPPTLGRCPSNEKRCEQENIVSSLFRTPTSSALLCLEARRDSRIASHGNARNGHGARCRVTDSSPPRLVMWSGMEWKDQCGAAGPPRAPSPPTLGPCLVVKIFCKIFHILHHIESCDTWSTKYR